MAENQRSGPARISQQRQKIHPAGPVSRFPQQSLNYRNGLRRGRDGRVQEDEKRALDFDGGQWSALGIDWTAGCMRHRLPTSSHRMVPEGNAAATKHFLSREHCLPPGGWGTYASEQSPRWTSSELAKRVPKVLDQPRHHGSTLASGDVLRRFVALRPVARSCRDWQLVQKSDNREVRDIEYAASRISAHLCSAAGVSGRRKDRDHQVPNANLYLPGAESRCLKIAQVRIRDLTVFPGTFCICA